MKRYTDFPRFEFKSAVMLGRYVAGLRLPMAAKPHLSTLKLNRAGSLHNKINQLTGFLAMVVFRPL